MANTAQQFTVSGSVFTQIATAKTKVLTVQNLHHSLKVLVIRQTAQPAVDDLKGFIAYPEQAINIGVPSGGDGNFWAKVISDGNRAVDTAVVVCDGE
jgi:hypothetical protein